MTSKIESIIKIYPNNSGIIDEFDGGNSKVSITKKSKGESKIWSKLAKFKNLIKFKNYDSIFEAVFFLPFKLE